MSTYLVRGENKKAHLLVRNDNSFERRHVIIELKASAYTWHKIVTMEALIKSDSDLFVTMALELLEQAAVDKGEEFDDKTKEDLTHLHHYVEAERVKMQRATTKLGELYA